MIGAFVLMQIALGAGAINLPGSAGIGPTNLSDIHMKLHGVPGVKTVHFLAGPTDVIAFAEVADMAALAETLTKIRAINGIASTDTRMVWPI